MPHFLISYDLHKQRTYEPVWKKLHSWGAVRLLESLWVVSGNLDAGQMRLSLQAVVDNDDSIVVIELKAGSEWSSLRAKPAGTDWLSRSIKRY